MTRWGLLDLTARLIDHQIKNPDADQWEVVEFPAILNENTEGEKSLWPEKWSLEELRSTRAAIDPRYWTSQYQQTPTSEVSAIIKRDYWRIWPEEDPPECSYVMMSVDTAHETKDINDYSACTMWGVFYTEIQTGKDIGKQSPNIIMLDAFKDRMEFPELKEVMYRHWKEWQPDTFIVEKKAAGAPLIQEFRRMGIPVQEYSPSRMGRGVSNDKVARVNAVSDLFASGKVWAPDRRWAKEVIEECASFPVGEHDDYVDTMTQALLRFRQGGFITIDSDEEQAQKTLRRRSERPFY
jgi:predicted phage terminase large subunit-like protein